MSERTITRKRFLVAGAAALGSAPAAKAAPGAADGLAGVLRAGLENGRALVEAADGVVEVQLEAGAVAERALSGRFVAGDEVGAEGRWRGDTFAATRLLSLLRPIEGRLIGRRGMAVVTSAGSARLTESTRVRIGEEWFGIEALGRLHGREVAVHTMRDPESGSALAVDVALDVGADE
jgi:hypothetical protein